MHSVIVCFPMPARRTSCLVARLLLYETPDTTFTLTILYGTPGLYDDDDGDPNPPAWGHVEQWIWSVNADFESLADLLDLFHELPFGQDEVPLVSDEELYDVLQAKIEAARDAYETEEGMMTHRPKRLAALRPDLANARRFGGAR